MRPGRRGTSSVRGTFRVRDVIAGNTRVMSTPLTACAAARPVTKEADRTDFDREGVSRPQLRPRCDPIALGRQATSRPRLATRSWLRSRRYETLGLASTF